MVQCWQTNPTQPVHSVPGPGNAETRDATVAAQFIIFEIGLLKDDTFDPLCYNLSGPTMY
jgi:hypothetical protein